MKLSLKIGMVLSTSTLLFIGGYAAYEARRSEAELLRDAQMANAALLGQSMPAMGKAFWNFDKGVLESALESFFKYGDVRRAYVFDDKGQIFTAYSRKTASDKPEAVDTNDSSFLKMTNLPGETPHAENSGDEKNLIKEAPVSDAGLNRLVGTLWVAADGDAKKFVGHVLLDFSTSYISDRVAALRMRVWGLALFLSLGISLVAILYLRLAAVIPISELASASADLAKHTFTKVKQRRSKDEIGQLAASFNNMVDEVRSHITHQKLLAEAVKICSQALTFGDLHSSVGQAFSLLAEEAVSVELHILNTPSKPQMGINNALRTLGIQSITSGQMVASVQFTPLSSPEKEEQCLPLFEALCVTIANTIRNIEYAIEQKAHGKVEAEIAATKAVQDALIPQLSSFPNIDLASYYQSADTTGGDWYGYHYHQETGIAYFFVGDVTGHGIPSALITGVVCGAVMAGERHADTYSEECEPSKRLLNTISILNSIVLETGARSSKLMTMFIAAIDVNTGKMWTVNAAHNPPLLIHTHGESKPLMNMGTRLGFATDGDFRVKEYALVPGDILFLYTDGLVENSGPDAKCFELKHLRKSLEQHSHSTKDLNDLVRDVLKSGGEIWQENPPADDVTILALRWTGPKSDLAKNPHAAEEKLETV